MRTFPTAVLTAIALITPVLGDPADPNPNRTKWLSTEKADAAIAEEDWTRAEADLERILRGLRDRSYRAADLGPIYFKLGWCQLKQAKWLGAMRAFETCYKKYPSAENDHNPFQIESLRRWAEAATGAAEFETAIRMYRKYITESTEPDPNDPFGVAKPTSAKAQK